MQLMADAISVLGSRHGILLDPIHRKCGMIRYDHFGSLPEIHLRAGVIIGGKEVILPLAPDGEAFTFHDQRLSPCTFSLIGIYAPAALKVKLSVVTPFRPRDVRFSVTPVLGLRLEAELLKGRFRWSGKSIELDEVELFIEVGGAAVTTEAAGDDGVDVRFISSRRSFTGKEMTPCPQRDRLIALTGQRVGTRFRTLCGLGAKPGRSLDLAWCSYAAEGLQIQGQAYPFKYSRWFQSLDDVAAWARTHPLALFDNAARVDGLIARNTCGPAVNHLMATSLHSWLMCSWFIQRGRRDWFSVWEGSCYLHSTVDVEFTQAPFYLAVWPELLGIELDTWPEYSKPGTRLLGERGQDTLFLSHDMGKHCYADGQSYTHEMEVEETTNYLLLSYAYWKRTGDDALLKKHADTIERYLRFVLACDPSGNGVPSLGVANTIDDASPAIQFGKQQVYLAVKAMAAFDTGASMLTSLGRKPAAGIYRRAAAKVRRVIARKGWQKDHFVTLMDKDGSGLINPWSGKTFNWKEVPGWDAAHIYTVNGIAVLDMVGYRSGLDARRLKTDLRVATERCLREYGCVHSDFKMDPIEAAKSMEGLVGVARSPGWISMNTLRDIAAFYRGVDLRNLAERYWNWQVVTNSQEPKGFFETFNGNNLCFYPRGIAVWGFFEALGGLVINQADKIDRANSKFPQVAVPRLYDADWRRGSCRILGAPRVP